MCAVNENKKRSEEIKAILERRRGSGGSAAMQEIRTKLNDSREKFKDLVVCVYGIRFCMCGLMYGIMMFVFCAETKANTSQSIRECSQDEGCCSGGNS